MHHVNFLQPHQRGVQHFSLPEYSENSGKCISITLSTHQERNFEYTVWKVIRNKILLMLILPSSADGKIMQNDGKARITGTRESVRQRSARGRTEPTAGYRRWSSPAAGGVCKVTAVERWQAEGSESRTGKA